MNQNRRKKKNDRPVIRILLLGLVILFICMLVCLSHVVDVQKCFMHMKTAETRNNISDASRFIDNQTTNTLEIVQQAAVLMTADGRAMTDDNIFSILERYSIMETFSKIYYIDAENISSTELIKVIDECIPRLPQIKKEIGESLVSLKEKAELNAEYAIKLLNDERGRRS